MNLTINMNNNEDIFSSKNIPNYTQWVYGLIVLHVILWTVVPTILRHSLPMDALEGFVWGQSWQFGYDRNPWLNAWLTHIALVWGGYSGWMIYGFSQLSVALCFWSVWQLAKRMLAPVYALVAVFLLEFIQYYSIAAVDFNDNVLELGLWALTIWYFYNALLEQKCRHWLLTGFFAALSLMAKYYAIVLFLPMLVFLLMTREGRQSFKYSGIYLSGIIFVLIIAPHFIWLFQHGFTTLNYAVMRISDIGSWQYSWWHFFSVHLLAFLVPCVLFFLLLCLGKDNRSTGLAEKSKLCQFDKKFLILLALGPFVSTVLFALIFKCSLHVMWGTPLLSLWGVLLVAFCQPSITVKKFYRFIGVVGLVFFLVLSIYSYNIVFTGYASSATYPGKMVAGYLERTWASYSHKDPFYVVGDRYTAGNVAYFSSHSKLTTCIWDDKIYSCDDDKLRSRGAIFVWRADAKEAENAVVVQNKVKKKFPQVIILPQKKFHWIYHRDKPQIILGMALLLPE